MAKVTVWTFDSQGGPIEVRGLRAAATQGAIDRFGYVRRGESLEVDERLLDSDGLTIMEYLTFRVRVPHSHAFAGYSENGQRLQVMNGEYDARLTLREFDPIVGGIPCVQMVGGDSRGGDLWIKVEEFDELAHFPDVEHVQHMEVLGPRVTEPEEL